MSVNHTPNMQSPARPRWRRVIALWLLVALSVLVAPATAQAPAVPGSKQASEQQKKNVQKDLEGLQLEKLVQGNPLEAATWKRAGERLFTRFVDGLPDLVYALIVALFFVGLYLALRRVLRAVFERQRADPALIKISIQLTRYTLLAVGAIMAAAQLGFEVGSVIAGLGVVGLAVGLAAQDTLGNVIAGLTILWDRPFRTGDHVTIAGTFGRVMYVGLRSTHIRTVEELDTFLPNKNVVDQKIINHTMNPRLRLAISLGIAYKEDIRQARRVLLDAVRGNEHVADTPEPTVVVTQLADSAVNLELRIWLKDAYNERAASVDVLEIAKLALDEAGIEIPFPQRTVHMAERSLPETPEVENA
jgi:small conductance mechanosensitive channel